MLAQGALPSPKGLAILPICLDHLPIGWHDAMLKVAKRTRPVAVRDVSRAELPAEGGHMARAGSPESRDTQPRKTPATALTVRGRGQRLLGASTCQTLSPVPSGCFWGCCSPLPGGTDPNRYTCAPPLQVPGGALPSGRVPRLLRSDGSVRSCGCDDSGVGPCGWPYTGSTSARVSSTGWRSPGEHEQSTAVGHRRTAW